VLKNRQNMRSNPEPRGSRILHIQAGAFLTLGHDCGQRHVMIFDNPVETLLAT